MSFEPQPSSSRLPSTRPLAPPSDQQHSTTPPLPVNHYQSADSSEPQTPILPLPLPLPSVKKIRQTNHVKTIMTTKSATTTAFDKKLGTTILPVTRVTRAAKQDKDIKIVSKEAVFLISVATEFFVRKLTESAFFNAKLDKRVFVKYNDVAKAVQMNDEYMWLDDVIPISRPLISVLNDPSIPSSSTSLTNQMPELLPRPATPLPTTATHNGSSTITHSPLVVAGAPSNEAAAVAVANVAPGDEMIENMESMEAMEADEDELDEDL